MSSSPTSVQDVSKDPMKVHMLQYASNMMFLHELYQQMKAFKMTTFSDKNVQKLAKVLQEDIDLIIWAKSDTTHTKVVLLISSIGQILRSLKQIRGGGKSGASQEGNLTQLDRDLKNVFWDFIHGDKVAERGQDVTGEPLGSDDAVPPVKTSHVWDNFRLDLDPAAVQRVKKVLGARPTAESTKSTEPSQTPAPAPASKKPSPAATFATPDGMRQECSKRKKMADSNLKRRFCHVEGLRQTSERLVEEAVNANPMIGEVALEARMIMSEDRWDIWGKSIAQLMGCVYEDSLEQIKRGGDILKKLHADA